MGFELSKRYYTGHRISKLQITLVKKTIQVIPRTPNSHKRGPKTGATLLYNENHPVSQSPRSCNPGQPSVLEPCARGFCAARVPACLPVLHTLQGLSCELAGLVLQLCRAPGSPAPAILGFGRPACPDWICQGLSCLRQPALDCVLPTVQGTAGTGVQSRVPQAHVTVFVRACSRAPVRGGRASRRDSPSGPFF